MQYNNRSLKLVLLFATCLGILTLSYSCKKNISIPKEECLQQPPTNELCEASFQRWFYNSNQNECELKAYSGCSVYGFGSKVDCENQCTLLVD